MMVAEEWADLESEEAARRVVIGMVIGIETDRGPLVQALIAAGYVVFPINPLQVARCRQRHSTSGAKSDGGDAHVLAEIVRLDREHPRHRPAGDSPDVEAVKLLARTPPAPAGSCSPATRATAGSPTRCTSGRSAR